MFTSTLRYNLDPFHEHADARLWEVLGLVGLMQAVEKVFIASQAGWLRQPCCLLYGHFARGSTDSVCLCLLCSSSEASLRRYWRAGRICQLGSGN